MPRENPHRSISLWRFPFLHGFAWLHIESPIEKKQLSRRPEYDTVGVTGSNPCIAHHCKSLIYSELRNYKGLLRSPLSHFHCHTFWQRPHLKQE
jgi:hypothetical protein